MLILYKALQWARGHSDLQHIVPVQGILIQERGWGIKKRQLQYKMVSAVQAQSQGSFAAYTHTHTHTHTHTKDT